MMHRLAARTLLPILLVVAPATAAAQATASLTGAVRSDAREAVAGAVVRFTPGADSAATGPDGRFVLRVPAGIAGRVSVRASGFAPLDRVVTAPAAGGSLTLNFTLSSPTQLRDVVARGAVQRPLVNRTDGTAGGAIDSLELTSLPTDGRSPLDLAFTIPGVAQATGYFDTAPPLSIDGANSLYTQYYIDGKDNNEGILGGPRVDFPLSAISLLEVRTHGYGADLGRSSNGVVNYVTKQGGDAWHGEAFVEGRPGGIFDQPRFFAPDASSAKGFTRTQLGASGGGPLVADKTFVFGAAEYLNQTQGQTISTTFGSGDGSLQTKKVKLFGRADQRWNEHETTTIDAAFSRTSFIGQGGGQMVPEADVTQNKIGGILGVTHKSTWADGRSSNTISAQLGTFHWYYPPTGSTLTTPRVTVLSPDLSTVEAIVGSSGFQYDERERQFNFKDVFETAFGNHVLQVGGDVVTARHILNGAGTNLAGAYTVIDSVGLKASAKYLSLKDIPASIPVLSYTIDAQPQRIDVHQTVVGAFVQDRWRPWPLVTVNMGLRWDYDDITSRGASSPQYDNVQPRLSVNWSATPTLALHAAAGRYVGKFDATIYSDAIQGGPNGAAVVSYTGADAPAFGQGKTAAQLAGAVATLPPREERVTFASGLKNPDAYQGVIGFDWQFDRAWSISVEGVYSRTYNLPRLTDLNAVSYPLTAADTVNRDISFGDARRPVTPVTGSFRQLLTTESNGHARYMALFTTLRHAFTHGWSADLTWVWSHAKNDTEDINFAATQGNNFALEWADAVNDRRHKVSLRTVYRPTPRLTLTSISDFQTGTPVNLIAGFKDLDGSGVLGATGYSGNYDRYPGVARNSARLPASLEFNVGAAYALPVGKDRVQLRADVFNLLNRQNLTGFANGIAGGGPRTQVGVPLGQVQPAFAYTVAGRPRQVQLTLAYAF